jgi:outer membrane protein assembly factor BamB
MPTPGQSLVAADGCVYMLLQTPVPTKEQFIAAVDILTGKERWRIPHTKISADPAMKLATAGLGVVVAVAEKKTKVVGKDGKETEQKTNDIKVLSAATGEQLWEIPKVGNDWAPLVDGMLWNGNKKYDAKTGEVKGTLTTGLNSPGCTPAAVVGSKFVTASRGCGYIDMAPDPGPDPAKPVTGSKYVQFGGARGGCLEGSVPANGMFYTSQNFCRCAPGQVQGFIAFGPSGSLPTSAEFETARPVEKGPAFGAVKDAPPAPGDWTTFMHDAQRSGCAATKLPEKLKVLWQSPAAKPPEGPLAAAWLARLRSCITAPVVAGGKVFAACVDDGQIVALDAATGKAAWHFTAGTRIDSPPTIARGLCVFGCYDGWVYALRADDGQLVWRTRAAPMERRMVAFGQVESVWPALGSVIVRDNVVLATAGRTTESDGGLAVVALDAATGQHVWAKGVAPGPNRVNDVLVAREDKVTVQHVMLDGKTGTPDTKSKAFKTSTLEGLVDGTWTRVGTRRSGTHNFGRACAELLVWNDETVFGYQCQPRMVFAMPRQQAEAEGKLTGKENTWQFNLPANHQAQGMVLLKANALEDASIVLGGMVCQPPENKVTGFVCVVSADKGKMLVELPLPAAPVYAGLAVTDGKVYASLEDGSVVCLGKAD